jgi:hypothetical protein
LPIHSSAFFIIDIIILSLYIIIVHLKMLINPIKFKEI